MYEWGTAFTPESYPTIVERWSRRFSAAQIADSHAALNHGGRYFELGTQAGPRARSFSFGARVDKVESLNTELGLTSSAVSQLLVVQNFQSRW